MPTPFGSFPFDANGIDLFAHPITIGDAMRVPTTNDIYNPGTQWLNNAVNPKVMYFTTGAGNWFTLNGAGTFTTLSVNSGSATIPDITSLDGGIKVTPTDVTAGASPQIANNRFFKVVFSGVSIAAGATQTFVITNSTITDANTDILLSLVGGTSGSALSIQSFTPSAGSVSIVVANGTGATTSTANLTFVGWVLD